MVSLIIQIVDHIHFIGSLAKSKIAQCDVSPKFPYHSAGFLQSKFRILTSVLLALEKLVMFYQGKKLYIFN